MMLSDESWIAGLLVGDPSLQWCHLTRASVWLWHSPVIDPDAPDMQGACRYGSPFDPRTLTMSTGRRFERARGRVYLWIARELGGYLKDRRSVRDLLTANLGVDRSRRAREA